MSRSEPRQRQGRGEQLGVRRRNEEAVLVACIEHLARAEIDKLRAPMAALGNRRSGHERFDILPQSLSESASTKAKKKNCGPGTYHVLVFSQKHRHARR